MAAPKTTEEAFQQMRFMWFAFLASILLYIYIATTTPPPAWLNFRNATRIFPILGVLDLVYFAWFRTKRFPGALQLAQERPRDIHAIRRWVAAWITLAAIAETEALFGLCLQWGNKSPREATPLYALGFVLIASLWPQHVHSRDSITE
ncbi:MAG TPA: hypothetical protein VKT50_03905 [Candidatus Acidoferrales bacterium]|nr:hypothetical protein [Candidatus Acidoferrales bacterium]